MLRKGREVGEAGDEIEPLNGCGGAVVGLGGGTEGRTSHVPKKALHEAESRLRRGLSRRDADPEAGRLRLGAEQRMRAHHRTGVGGLHLGQRLHLHRGDVRKYLRAVQIRHETRQHLRHRPGGNAQEDRREHLFGQGKVHPDHIMPRRAPTRAEQRPHPAPATDDHQTPRRKAVLRIYVHTRTFPQHSQKFGNDLPTQAGLSSVRRAPRSSSRARLMAMR